jgi:CheY-like chemotaxis protein
VRIPLVEDESRLAGFIAKGLREQAYTVDIAAGGEEALYSASENDYDLIILDLILPVIDRVIVCRRLRSSGLRKPILMLTGLAIVKWIAESHNGRVELSSSPEAGSTFTVTLCRQGGKNSNAGG